jgi:hypothetical protein
MLDKLEHVQAFAKRIKALLDWFTEKSEPPASSELSIRDCDDAMNIAKPIANHGGTQNFFVVHPGGTANVFAMSSRQAQTIIEHAKKRRGELTATDGANPERREGVAMTWSRLAKERAKTEGARSPDRGLIEEIDLKPHAVLFTDDLTYLKQEMIADSENPLQQVYFVDVEITRASGRVAGYRVVGYHGKDDLPRPD